MEDNKKNVDLDIEILTYLQELSSGKVPPSIWKNIEQEIHASNENKAVSFYIFIRKSALSLSLCLLFIFGLTLGILTSKQDYADNTSSYFYYNSTYYTAYLKGKIS